MISFDYRGPVKMVVFDWAGTTVDHGCFAPIAPFIETLRRHGVEISVDEARRPMGMAKKDHLRALMTAPEIAPRWERAQGRPSTEDDVTRLYEGDFVPLQLKCVEQHSQLIEGLLPCVEWLRSRGVHIVTTTGYFREAAEICYAVAARQGYQPDANLTASDVSEGRPAPWMIYRHMERFGVYPPSAVLKVGDTVPDIGEGRNAGVWTAGVARTCSEVGLTHAEYLALAPEEQQRRLHAARTSLLDAGAHYVIDSIADVPGLIEEIEDRNDSDYTR